MRRTTSASSEHNGAGRATPRRETCTSPLSHRNPTSIASRKLILSALGCVLLLSACTGSDARARPGGAPAPEGTGTGVTDSATPRRDTVVAADSIRRPKQPLVPTPNPVRGLYVNRWAAIGDRMWQLIDVAKRTEVNALVIDVKDDRGFMLYHSQVPLAKEIGAGTTGRMSYRRMRAVLD